MKCRIVMLMIVMMFAVSAVIAQVQLDSRPLDPEKDPDIDMFMGSWQNSIPFNTHGSITERAIMTKLNGDPFWPKRKAAVLTAVNRFSRGTIDPHVSTTPTTLKGEQEVFYIVSGEGVIEGGNTRSELRNGIFVLVPEGIEFVIANTGNNHLVMYIINEPVSDGFTPKTDLVIKDEKAMPYRNDGYLKVHWSHNGKNVFTAKDGLATLKSVNLLIFNAMTIGQPHSHGNGGEEVWTVIEGKNLAFLGKEIRWQMPGTAYKIPPTGYTPHSNINTTEEPILFLYFSRL
ncbi:cupin domain-containing protein [Candidatus Latescibacterota bacterium]